MAKWKYVGPYYASGILVGDGSLLYPDAMSDEDIDTTLVKYPQLSPLWISEGGSSGSGGSGNSECCNSILSQILLCAQQVNMLSIED